MRVAHLVLLGGFFLLIASPIASAASESPNPSVQVVDANPVLDEEAMAWISFGLGGLSLSFWLLALLGATFFALPAVAFGMLGFGFSIWLRKFRRKKDWRSLIGLLSSMLVTVVFLSAWGLVLFF